MKISYLTTLTLSLFALAASANGVRQGQPITSKIAAMLGNSTLLCASNTDRVVLQVNNVGGGLRMIAGNSSGKLDTNNEGSGEECGGLFATADSSSGTVVLNDVSDDCERGKWNYRLVLSNNSLAALAHKSNFTALGTSGVRDTNSGAAVVLNCAVR